MTYYVRLDGSDNIVATTYVNDFEITDPDGNVLSDMGLLIARQKCGGTASDWRTETDASGKGPRAIVGGTYDSSVNNYYPPKPGDDFVKNTTTINWVPSS
tara:strand:- start:75 stop:374 length:300 start_codon:yes stop_codon:yes gene_type:complete